jgi:hypothetical protein
VNRIRSIIEVRSLTGAAPAPGGKEESTDLSPASAYFTRAFRPLKSLHRFIDGAR